MAAKIRALANPALLVWARETAGFKPEEAAKRIGLSTKKLLESESGRDNVTINQLRSMSRVYKRPVAVFYLPAPPQENIPVHDYRRLPGKAAGIQSPALRFEIRKALYRRGAALELFRESGTDPVSFNQTAQLDDGTETVSRRIREFLTISLDQQRSFADPYGAYNRWRIAFERIGIMVFQGSISELNEMRGFSISESPLPVIVVNSKDSVYGRIFSMFHEMAHLMLREGGLCNFDETIRSPRDRKVEVFCNAVAGGALVPQDALLSTELVASKQGRAWDDEELKQLASLFSVSREVILRRLLTSNLISDRFYSTKQQQYQKEFAARPKTKGFASPAVKAVSIAGLMFSQLVLDNYSQDRITSSDVSDLLGVRLKHIGSVEEAVQNRLHEVGAGL